MGRGKWEIISDKRSGNENSFEEQLWSAKRVELIGDALRKHGKHELCISISGDGNNIVSDYSYNTIRLWDAESEHLFVSHSEYI